MRRERRWTRDKPRMSVTLTTEFAAFYTADFPHQKSKSVRPLFAFYSVVGFRVLFNAAVASG